MKRTTWIAAPEFCNYHEITIHFIEELADYDLIQTTVKKQTLFFAEDQLPQVEKYIRLHRDLQINTEGLQVVSQLIEKIDRLQDELIRLQNTVNFRS